jgi:excinuclease ABC subunit A
LLDEPTTGLHFDDVRKLLEVLHRLADLGNSVIIIEHNLDVIRNADWILDLGPEGGEDGGRIVAEGRPEEIAATSGSYTGQFLARYYSGAHLPACDPREAGADSLFLSGNLSNGQPVPEQWSELGAPESASEPDAPALDSETVDSTAPDSDNQSSPGIPSSPLILKEKAAKKAENHESEPEFTQLQPGKPAPRKRAAPKKTAPKKPVTRKKKTVLP